jgi:dipeptidyl aminopeptidase/acylaminoacyl peptidase
MKSSFLALFVAIAASAGAHPQQAPATPPQQAPAPLGKVPIETFAQLPAFEDPELSPDGTRITAKLAIDGKQYLVAQQLFDANAKPRVFSVGDTVDINWWQWAGNDWLAVGLGAQSDVADQSMYITRLLSLSIATQAMNRIDWDHSGQRADDVIWAARDGSANILLSKQTSFYQDGFYPTVFRVDLATGKMHAVNAGRTNVFDWFADASGALRMGYSYDDDSLRGQLLYRAGDRSGFDVIEQSKGIDDDLAIPEALGPNGSGVVLDDTSGREAVYDVTLPGMALGKMIYGSPKYDVDGVVVDQAGTGIDGISITDHTSRIEWLNPRFKELQDNLDKTLGAGHSQIVSWNRDRTRLLVHVGDASQPGALYYWDTSDARLQFFGWYNDALKGAALSPVSTIDYAARDGLPIEAVLTLPRGRPAKNLPLIVLPHGGPQARDDEEWDWWVQFLAESGYAVVQPNYRGSTGYGTAFERAGEGQWGLKMQDDLNDAVTYLAKQGIADPKRVCIAGASYGGYAAMRAAERDGGMYRCAISYAGVSDLGAMRGYDSQFLYGKTNGAWLKAQAPDFKAISPRFDAASFSIPILLVHGKADRRVPVKQSRMMADALKAVGKTYEYDEQPLADHHFTRAADRLDFLTRMKAFLDKYNPA